MTIDYKTLRNWQLEPIEQRYTTRDVILYSLGVGYGLDPLDQQDLHYVYERDLRVPPTFAAVLGAQPFWESDPRAGIDWVKLLHGEETMTFHHPLPREATVIGQSSVTRLTDKGPGKGALLEIECSITDKASGVLYATVTQLLFLRGDGGFSAANGLSDPPPKSPPAVPDRPADYVVDLPTHAEAALIYRLSGDFNTLHVDPEIARAAGFNRPILHGLATLGIVGHALLKAVCDNDPAKLASLQVRFTSPVYPGETIRTEIWRENEQIRMRARAVERDVIVINNGLAYLR